MAEPRPNPHNAKYLENSPIGKKGYCGNPGGRKAMPERYRKAFFELSELGIKCLRAILDGSDPTAKARERVRAAEIAFDRAYGKPLQTVEAHVQGGVATIDTTKLTSVQIDAIAALAIQNMNMEATDADEGEDAEDSDV